MKKITLLSLLISAFAFAQQPTNYADVDLSTVDNTVVSSNGATVVNRSGGGTVTYTDRATFQSDYASNCSSGTLVLEDFAGSPAGVTTCGPVVSDAGDGCFPAGEIVADLSITASNGTDVVAITSGTIGNTSNLVGANTFAEFTIVNFDTPTAAAGMEIWNNSDPTTEVRLFNSGGTLIETYTLSLTVGGEDFFGFIASEDISRIEIEEANDGGDLIGMLEFGSCTLSIDDNALNQISIYPNPVNDVINVKAPSNIQINSAVIYDVLGKATNAQVINGQINVAELARGVYILNLNTSAGTLTQKVVKQ